MPDGRIPLRDFASMAFHSERAQTKADETLLGGGPFYFHD
jgi:hypothetical protein